MLLRLCAHIPVWLLRPAVWVSLTVAVLEDLKRQGLKVVPLCRFMARYILRHPEWKQMVADK